MCASSAIAHCFSNKTKWDSLICYVIAIFPEIESKSNGVYACGISLQRTESRKPCSLASCLRFKASQKRRERI